MKRHRYFVSYSHDRGMGYCNLTRNNKIKNFNDIEEIRQTIENTIKVIKEPVIMNFILLGKEKVK